LLVGVILRELLRDAHRFLKLPLFTVFFMVEDFVFTGLNFCFLACYT
jgi:hypothetical protein